MGCIRFMFIMSAAKRLVCKLLSMRQKGDNYLLRMILAVIRKKVEMCHCCWPVEEAEAWLPSCCGSKEVEPAGAEYHQQTSRRWELIEAARKMSTKGLRKQEADSGAGNQGSVRDQTVAVAYPSSWSWWYVVYQRYKQVLCWPRLFFCVSLGGAC